ncbi:hypothetical protein [Ornithinimicrobium cavernae]|uniref:hypothetical protein n=1 Tax=Ornithinimicrobium cavernae TaxID=2666047 RepID=UPI000D68A675|nr:hypothetical protein [Ornithinimicrobium cavernae]
MSFLESAVLLAWVALVLLALGLAGLLRQVTLLTRGQAGGGSQAAASGSPRSTRDLVGFRLPAHGELAGLAEPGAHRTVVTFVSPGCSSCDLTLSGLTDVPDVRDGSVALVAVSTGSCGPALGSLSGTGRCVAEGRALLEQLHVPATPYLMALDSGGTIVAATLPDQHTDLTAWVRATRGSISLTEEQG